MMRICLSIRQLPHRCSRRPQRRNENDYDEHQSHGDRPLDGCQRQDLGKMGIGPVGHRIAGIRSEGSPCGRAAGILPHPPLPLFAVSGPGNTAATRTSRRRGRRDRAGGNDVRSRRCLQHRWRWVISVSDVVSALGGRPVRVPHAAATAASAVVSRLLVRAGRA
jgi:hypothetical protein